MPGRRSDTEFESASDDGGWSPTASSVDTEQIWDLLEELNIAPWCESERLPAAGKRTLGLDSGCLLSTSPSSNRPYSTLRLESSSAGPPAAAAIAARSPPPARQLAAAAPADVIDLLDSSGSDTEGDWQIAAPRTAQKRYVVDSDDEEEQAYSKAASSNTAGTTALPPFLAAIPSLAAAVAAQPGSLHSTQQHAAPPPPRQTVSAQKKMGAGSGSLPAGTFKRQRGELTAQLFQEFNRTVFGGRLPADLEITWNSRLLTTAGLTHYRRDIPDDPYAPPIYSARVELSSKVLDGFEKLERTLCHELCHVAAWLLDHTAKPPHGPVFKAWAGRAMQLYRHLDITTCHAYQIFYPFRWQCSNQACLQEYGRHSNSIDVAKKVCGACRAPLTFLGRFRPDGTPAKPRTAAASKFVKFVKENHAQVRAQLPAGTPQKVVMQQLSVKYAEARQQQQQQQDAGQ